MIKRTHTCGELTLDNLDSKVSLNGWISKIRDLGGLIFIDLRDRYGVTQVFFNEKTNEDVFNIAKKLGLEDVIGVTGNVIKRPDDAINKSMVTGFIDIDVNTLIVYHTHKLLIVFINSYTVYTEFWIFLYHYITVYK